MTDTSIFLTTARTVIRKEAAALEALAEAVGDSFARCVDIILSSKGRVIVTGIGKSGHIARKIAATLASTGTPSQFVHPAEASHGDMGMVTQQDVVLAISNSGEAPELANLIAYSRRFGIPLAAITSRNESTLGREADIVILMPKIAEACTTGVVPTTSTTMTLALGDALAVALMEHRSFTADDFREYHPGGKLGARLARVRDLMHRGDQLPLVRKSSPMSDCLLTISQKGFGVAGVVAEEGSLCGIVTDGDLRRNMSGLLDKTVGQVMTPDPSTINSDALAEEAVALMNEHKITCLFVLDAEGEGEAVGILHIHDCLRAGVV